MDDSGEVVTTATTAARYVSGHARPSDLAHIRKRAR